MSTLERQLSNTSIDKAGRILAQTDVPDLAKFEQAENQLNMFRQAHLGPLTEFTLQLQQWLSTYGGDYYVAQRLKRKPQIIRKLRRLSVRLTQLQDIGGARIVVKTNKDVDRLYQHLKFQLESQELTTEVRKSDYRVKGRDESGYRALHVIIKRNGRLLELQLRSEAQHYWAEQIERASIIYGYHLKEQEGDESVIEYFHALSDVFYEIESGREPTTNQKLQLDRARQRAEMIIRQSDRKNVFNSSVNEGAVKAMIAQNGPDGPSIRNWIIVFDWNTGSFIAWNSVSRNPDEAMKVYVKQEQTFPADQGYEVVMVGSSDATMIRHTHSHYFGIESYEAVLSTLEGSIQGLSRRMAIGLGERQILQAMSRRKYWTAAKSVKPETLKNHYCKSVLAFDECLDWLLKEGLVLERRPRGPLYLNIQLKTRIESSV
jgi:ppGpp synthetase/RelA/SpoT-type nucleotidyltranferase